MSVAYALQVSHVRFRAPDLALLATFLGDFGMDVLEEDEERLLARGAGADPFLYAAEHAAKPHFAAAGYRFAGIDDLERLAERDGLPVEEFDMPGGGKVVRLTDPDGFVIEAVAGQKRRAPIERDHEPSNAPKPCFVQQLSHVVLAVSDLERSQRWYQERLGLVASDEAFNDEGNKIAAFLRLDLGDVPSDHHALFLLTRPAGPGFVHAAFDVPDADDLIRGHEHLLAKQYQHRWGIGRHLLGNQIFDYWRDPWGHELEHCTGGDKFSAHAPVGAVGLKELFDVKWGAINPRYR